MVTIGLLAERKSQILVKRKLRTPFYKLCVALPAGPYFFLKKSSQKNIHKIMILSKNLIIKFYYKYLFYL